MFTPSLWRWGRLNDAAPELLRLQQEMNRLFSHAGQKTPQDFPAVNIWENQENAVVTAELPGLDPAKIDISVAGDTLTLAGVTEAETVKEKDFYLRQERGLGNFQRKIQLPFQLDAQKVEARYEKGVLTVTLPRIKESLPKKIKINS